MVRINKGELLGLMAAIFLLGLCLGYMSGIEAEAETLVQRCKQIIWGLE